MAATVCPDFKVVATPCQPDETGFMIQSVSMGLYPTRDAPEHCHNATTPTTDWYNIEIPMECKADSIEHDPFNDTEASGEPTTDRGKVALSRILSHAELVFRCQQRMFFFMLIFLGDFVRVARFDRSGIFVTRKFNYKAQGSPLSDFLYQYSRMSASERGHDPTASRIVPGSTLYDSMITRANRVNPEDPYDYVRELFKRSLNKKWPWWQLEIHTQSTNGRSRGVRRARVHRFVVGMPHFQAPEVAGRGTRGYVALPLNADGEIADSAKFVYLKDAWRLDNVGINQEGITLELLNDRSVPFVPTLICHGDLPGQVTVSQDHWHAFHPHEDKLRLERHHHYRLAVKEVGLPLEDFESSEELCLALYCCLLGVWPYACQFRFTTHSAHYSSRPGLPCWHHPLRH